MRVRVKLFGPAARAAGRDHADLTLPAGATCAHVLDALGSQSSELEPIVSGARLAVNHELADPGLSVNEGDEIALIALVSGG